MQASVTEVLSASPTFNCFNFVCYTSGTSRLLPQHVTTMGPSSHFFLAIFAASAMLQFQVSYGFEWEASSPPDGATIQACTGDTVSFPWKFSVTDEETIINVEWHRLTEGGDTMVAIHVAESLLKLPATTFNAVFLPSAGLEISGFTWEDYGTYRVTVNYRITNTLFSESLSVNLALPDTDAPVLKDDHLKAHVQPEPIVDVTTGKRHVQLKCGTFVELVTGAEVSVEWKTPSGDTMSSTSFSDGNFHLTLPDPVVGGTYTCYLKDRAVMARCMKNVHALEDSVLVDEVQAQLILLKGGIHRLSLKDQLIDAELKTQEKTDLELRASISRLHDKFTSQELANVNLNSEVQNLSKEMDTRKKKDSEQNGAIDGLQNDVTNVKDLQTKLKDKVDGQLQSEVSNLQSKHASDLDDVEKKLSKQESTDEKLLSSVARVEQELKSQGSKWVSRDDFEKLESKLETLSLCQQYKLHYQSSCYYIVNETLSWNAAKEKCRELGGKLAEIESSGENNYIKKIAQLGTEDLWLGGTDRETEGNWVWASSNKVMEFTNWATTDEPNNKGRNEHCLDLHKNYNYYWNDLDCHFPRMSVCEISRASL